MIELINEIIEYIEEAEEIIDAEFGGAREIEELIEDGDMPKLYYTLLKHKENLKHNQCCGKCKKEN